MKFDMSRAWNDAVAILTNNAGLMMIVVGLFVLLPNVALTMLIPETLQPPSPPAGAPPEQALEVMMAFYQDNLIWMFALGVLQMIGTLTLYALLSGQRPTVAEALKIGLIALIPYLLAQLLMAVVIALISGVLIGAPIGAGIPALAALTGILALVLIIYVVVKFSVTAPVIVIEGVLNPIAALQRSWKLTKGNSLRLFGYFVILGICLMVIAVLFSVFSSVIVSLMSGNIVGLLIAGLLNGLMAATFAVIGVGVIAAVHRQLAGDSGEDLTEAFE